MTLSKPVLAPLVRRDHPVLRLLTLPARVLDGRGPSVAPVDVPLAVRHQWLLDGSPPPEGWLAVQPGLATVGDAAQWASFAANGRTALAVGGVHGNDRVAAFRGFRERTGSLGYRRQAVYPVRAADLEAAREAGFGTLPIGVEAWVSLDQFTLRGKRFADLRQMRNRAANRGVHVEEVDPHRWQRPLAATWQAFLDARSVPWRVRWLSGAPMGGRQFGRRTFVAHRDRQVQAFCTVLPGGAGSASLDVMCRAPEAQPGSVESLLVAVLQRLRDEGRARVSLGPCPLAGGVTNDAPGALGVLFRWAWGSDRGDRWFGFRRLAAFKEKFRPDYEVVHLGLAPRISAWALYLVARIWALEGT